MTTYLYFLDLCGMANWIESEGSTDSFMSDLMFNNMWFDHREENAAARWYGWNRQDEK